MRSKIIHGDTAERLKQLPDNSIDSSVTDPTAGISNMNKVWYSDKGGRDKWIAWLSESMKEVESRMKP